MPAVHRQAADCEGEVMLAAAYEADEHSPRLAMEIAVNHIDDLLIAGELLKCDELLGAADVSQMSEGLIVSFLGITMAAKQKLSNREAFYQAAFAQVAKLRGSQIAAQKLLAKYH